jgi:UDP-2-acetamido-3-amino-2,3-dideoxy-glucuronate N-acetyltransferase
MSLITRTEHDSLSQAVHAGASRADHFKVVDPSAQVGEGTVVGPCAVVDAQVSIGRRCVLESAVHIARGSVVEDDVHLGAHAVLAGGPQGVQPAIVRQGAWIGANASVMAGVVIGAKSLVRPGAVVTRSVPPGAIVEGNPANIVGYVDTVQGPVSVLQMPAPARKGSVIEPTAVKGVTVHHFPVVPDLRGSLTVGEFDREIPFLPKRYFMVFGVPNREIRGEHAHHRCHQFLICVRGSCAVVADDGQQRVEVTLDSPDRGIYLPPMTWGVQYKYSADATLLVFASDYYDSADYIRDYADFIRISAAAAQK